jgi:hypothetical protein
MDSVITRYVIFDTGGLVSRNPAPAGPFNLVAPLITGTEQVGSTLSVTNGTWANSPSSYTYQWFRASTLGGIIITIGGLMVGVPIPGATSNTYLLVALDAGEFIFCEVTAINSSGSSMEQSNATGAIAPLVVFGFDDTIPNFSSGWVLSNGDRTAERLSALGIWFIAPGINAKSTGKRHLEFILNRHQIAEAFGFAEGITQADNNHAGSALNTSGVGLDSRNTEGMNLNIRNFTAPASYNTTYTITPGVTVIGLEIDLDNNKIWWSLDGNFNAILASGSSDPAAGTTPHATWVGSRILSPVFWGYAGGTDGVDTSEGTINTSGPFAYPPSSGFSAWDS